MSYKPRALKENTATRRQQRVQLKTPVCVVVPRPGRVLLVEAHFRDMSADGAAIFAGVELALDSEVQIEFTPPLGPGPLRVRAIVRNRRQYIYGVEFLPQSGDEEQTLGLLKALLLPLGSKVPGSPDDRR
jgi:PilZ domain